MATSAEYSQPFLERGYIVAPRVPRGLAAAVEGLAREVLRQRPEDIYVFAARHFEQLLKLREKNDCPRKSTDLFDTRAKEKPKMFFEVNGGSRTGPRLDSKTSGWSVRETARLFKKRRQEEAQGKADRRIVAERRSHGLIRDGKPEKGGNGLRAETVPSSRSLKRSPIERTRRVESSSDLERSLEPETGADRNTKSIRQRRSTPEKQQVLQDNCPGASSTDTESLEKVFGNAPESSVEASPGVSLKENSERQQGTVKRESARKLSKSADSGGREKSRKSKTRDFPRTLDGNREFRRSRTLDEAFDSKRNVLDAVLQTGKFEELTFLPAVGRSSSKQSSLNSLTSLNSLHSRSSSRNRGGNTLDFTLPPISCDAAKSSKRKDSVTLPALTPTGSPPEDQQTEEKSRSDRESGSESRMKPDDPLQFENEEGKPASENVDSVDSAERESPSEKNRENEVKESAEGLNEGKLPEDICIGENEGKEEEEEEEAFEADSLNVTPDLRDAPRRPDSLEPEELEEEPEERCKMTDLKSKLMEIEMVQRSIQRTLSTRLESGESDLKPESVSKNEELEELPDKVQESEGSRKSGEASKSDLCNEELDEGLRQGPTGGSDGGKKEEGKVIKDEQKEEDAKEETEEREEDEQRVKDAGVGEKWTEEEERVVRKEEMTKAKRIEEEELKEKDEEEKEEKQTKEEVEEEEEEGGGKENQQEREGEQRKEDDEAKKVDERAKEDERMKEEDGKRSECSRKSPILSYVLTEGSPCEIPESVVTVIIPDHPVGHETGMRTSPVEDFGQERSEGKGTMGGYQQGLEAFGEYVQTGHSTGDVDFLRGIKTTPELLIVRQDLEKIREEEEEEAEEREEEGKEEKGRTDEGKGDEAGDIDVVDKETETRKRDSSCLENILEKEEAEPEKEELEAGKGETEVNAGEVGAVEEEIEAEKDGAEPEKEAMKLSEGEVEADQEKVDLRKEEVSLDENKVNVDEEEVSLDKGEDSLDKNEVNPEEEEVSPDEEEVEVAEKKVGTGSSLELCGTSSVSSSVSAEPKETSGTSDRTSVGSSSELPHRPIVPELNLDSVRDRTVSSFSRKSDPGNLEPTEDDACSLLESSVSSGHRGAGVATLEDRSTSSKEPETKEEPMDSLNSATLESSREKESEPSEDGKIVDGAGVGGGIVEESTRSGVRSVEKPGAEAVEGESSPGEGVSERSAEVEGERCLDSSFKEEAATVELTKDEANVKHGIVEHEIVEQEAEDDRGLSSEATREPTGSKTGLEEGKEPRKETSVGGEGSQRGKAEADLSIEREIARELIENDPSVEDEIAKNLIENDPCIEDAIAKDLIENDPCIEDAIAKDLIENDPSIEDEIAKDLIENDPSIEQEIAKDLIENDPSIEQEIAKDLIENDPSIEDEIAKDLIENDPSIEQEIAKDLIENDPSIEQEIAKDLIENDPSIEDEIAKDLIENDPSIEQKIAKDLIENDPSIEQEIAKDLIENDPSIEQEIARELIANDQGDGMRRDEVSLESKSERDRESEETKESTGARESKSEGESARSEDSKENQGIKSEGRTEVEENTEKRETSDSEEQKEEGLEGTKSEKESEKTSDAKGEETLRGDDSGSSAPAEAEKNDATRSNAPADSGREDSREEEESEKDLNSSDDKLELREDVSEKSQDELLDIAARKIQSRVREFLSRREKEEPRDQENTEETTEEAQRSKSYPSRLRHTGEFHDSVPLPPLELSEIEKLRILGELWKGKASGSDSSSWTEGPEGASEKGRKKSTGESGEKGTEHPFPGKLPGYLDQTVSPIILLRLQNPGLPVFDPDVSAMFPPAEPPETVIVVQRDSPGRRFEFPGSARGAEDTGDGSRASTDDGKEPLPVPGGRMPLVIKEITNSEDEAEVLERMKSEDEKNAGRLDSSHRRVEKGDKTGEELGQSRVVPGGNDESISEGSSSESKSEEQPGTSEARVSGKEDASSSVKTGSSGGSGAAESSGGTRRSDPDRPESGRRWGETQERRD